MTKRNHLSGFYHEDHDCGCGHDHEHHHHHDGDCGCRHDHGHEHHHNHDDECGCGHHHNRDKVMIGKMSGHTLGTITCYTPATLPISELNMNLSMKDVNIFIREQGGIPMQLKASLKDNTTTVVMNMIGKDIIRAEGHDDNGIEEGKVKVNLLVICDGIADAVLKERLEELMSYFVNNSF